jgi:hypothetical protein
MALTNHHIPEQTIEKANNISGMGIFAKVIEVPSSLRCKECKGRVQALSDICKNNRQLLEP